MDVQISRPDPERVDVVVRWLKSDLQTVVMVPFDVGVTQTLAVWRPESDKMKIKCFIKSTPVLILNIIY